MAIVEQLIFGHRHDGHAGRTVLAASPELGDECLQEIVRLCEGWGAVPSEGLRRPALLAFPLESRMRALPGELYVAIHISQGLRPIYHALVLNARDYQEFDLNPFALLHEGVFLDGWTPGHELSRRTVTPGSFAPLVTPPPGPDDVGSIDEAVRQVLANQRLLLPLEHTSSDSDRFLALVVTGLPRAVRRELRFASWTPSATNRYTLAATHKESANFSAWQPFLMTSLTGKLDPESDEYLDDVRRHLQNGDLAGLERLSRETRLGATRSPGGLGARGKERTLTATVDEATTQKLKRRATQSQEAPAKRPPRPVTAATTATETRHRRPEPPRPPVRRSRKRRLTTRSGRLRRGLAVVLSAAIVGTGAYYLWTSAHWNRLPGLSTLGGALDARTEHGVVSVGAVYRAALADVQEGRLVGQDAPDEASRQRGLDLLRQAGQLLAVQARDYLQDGDQTLLGEERGGVMPAPAARLQSRGDVLASELRRLALARISLHDRVDWQDLADLADQPLAARYDSLIARRRTPAATLQDLRSLDLLLRRVEVTTRQVGGLSRLQDLLGQDAWDDGWPARVQAGADALGAVPQGTARRMRDDARVLARLKRAEHASGFASRAYRHPEAAQPLVTDAVAEVVPALHRRVEATDRDDVPPLLAATVEFYQALDEVQGGEVSTERLADLLVRLEDGRAVRFDAATYGDHVERLRFMLLQRCATQEAPEAVRPLLPDDDVMAEHLTFLRALHTVTDEAGWSEIAASCRTPFLARWASHEARRLDRLRAERARAFSVAHDELAGDREMLARCLAAGGDCGTIWERMATRLDDLQGTYGLGDAAATAGSAIEADLASLAATLADPPALALVGVTVRCGQSFLEQPTDVVVQLDAAGRESLASPVVSLGPAAPAGSGWVGAAEIDWTVPVRRGTPLVMRVTSAADGRELACFRCDGWLSACGPRDLGGLDTGAGVRLSWRLAAPYWSDVVLPPLSP